MESGSPQNVSPEHMLECVLRLPPEERGVGWITALKCARWWKPENGTPFWTYFKAAMRNAHNDDKRIPGHRVTRNGVSEFRKMPVLFSVFDSKDRGWIETVRDTHAPSATPEEDGRLRVLWNVVLELREQCTARQRSLLDVMLFYSADWTLQSLSEETGIPFGTVKSSMYAMRSQLAKKMLKDDRVPSDIREKILRTWDRASRKGRTIAKT